jgi:RNA polymerase sigma-70 factor (ECF subfamily)
MERLLPALRRYARGLSLDVSSADDLVQETVLRALSRERQFRGHSLSAWMFAILTNVARSRGRSERRQPSGAAPVDIADGGTDPAVRVGLMSALSGLSLEQREALLLTAVEGLSYRETAEVLDVPIGTVMSRIARARDQLAERLDGASVVAIRRNR